jgi:hypothetical protein
MWDLAQLLTGQYDSPLCALSMALPAAGLPADAARAAEQADPREAGGREAGAALTVTAAPLSFPGLGAPGDRHTFAECVVLRGARAGGAAAPLRTAAAALDAALLAEGGRCVRHRALTAQAMPVPLPFPGLFGPTVTRYGDLLPRPAGGEEATGHHVASCPALVRLAGSTALGGAARQIARQFAAAAAASQGQAALDSWGFGPEERAEASERLLQLGGAYDEEV